MNLLLWHQLRVLFEAPSLQKQLWLMKSLKDAFNWYYIQTNIIHIVDLETNQFTLPSLEVLVTFFSILYSDMACCK